LQPAGLAGPMSQETNRPTVLYTPKSHVRASRALPITLHYNHLPIRSACVFAADHDEGAPQTRPPSAEAFSPPSSIRACCWYLAGVVVQHLGSVFFVRRTPVSNLAYLDRPGGLRNRVQHFSQLFLGFRLLHGTLVPRELDIIDPPVVRSG
jgi:hypothetical protein